jgi:hypothetical protein
VLLQSPTEGVGILYFGEMVWDGYVFERLTRNRRRPRLVPNASPKGRVLSNMAMSCADDFVILIANYGEFHGYDIPPP